MCDQKMSLLHFPPEIRMKIVDRMEPVSRCRFSGCSKVSNQDAKYSKNYIYGLGIAMVFHDYITIIVTHAVCPNSPDAGYMLNFKKEGDKNIMTYFTQLNDRTWKKELDNSKSIVPLAFEYFNNLLRKYERNIKKLDVRGYFYEEVDFEVTNLRSLESLTVHHNSQSLFILSKVQHPLKELSILKDHFDNNPIEKVYQVQHGLFYPNLQLNNEQFLRLPEIDFSIHIGQLTVCDIFTFIQSWQNRTSSRRTLIHCVWFLTNSDFDVQQLFRMLQIKNGIQEVFPYGLDLKHSKHPWRMASLFGVNGDTLQVVFDNKTG